jgi:hypothetical protein
MIRVELIDGDYVRVSPKGLDLLLRNGRVRRFLRSSGWVVVGVDLIRDTARAVIYDGPERRQVPAFHVSITAPILPSASAEAFRSSPLDQRCLPRPNIFQRD